MRLLLCQLRNHGDIIRTFPLVDAIRSCHPNAFIAYTCFQDMEETCRVNKNIDAVITQPRFDPVTDTQGGTRILDCSQFHCSVERARSYHFDTYVDFHGVFQSAVFGAMCNIQRRLGRSRQTAKDGAELFYTHIAEIQSGEINRMGRHFKVVNAVFPEIKPLVPVCTSSSGRNRILIFPGSSRMGILKRWDICRYIELARRLSDDREVAFMIGPAERELADTIPPSEKTIMFSSWYEALSELECCSLVVSNDSAYAQLAVWKGCPTIIICGPTSPVVNGVWKYGRGAAIHEHEECAPCRGIWSQKCMHCHCCMSDISVERVIETANSVMGMD